jgi:pyruvate,water dikinase
MIIVKMWTLSSCSSKYIFPCDVTGVLFTKNPVTHDDEIMVEAVFDMGESLVSGEVTPGQFILDKDLQVKEQDVSEQKEKALFPQVGTQHAKAEKAHVSPGTN